MKLQKLGIKTLITIAYSNFKNKQKIDLTHLEVIVEYLKLLVLKDLFIKNMRMLFVEKDPLLQKNHKHFLSKISMWAATKTLDLKKLKI